MNTPLRSFVKSYLRVVLATLMVVAFISLPFVLGRPPGHEPVAVQMVDRHMT